MPLAQYYNILHLLCLILPVPGLVFQQNFLQYCHLDPQLRIWKHPPVALQKVLLSPSSYSSYENLRCFHKKNNKMGTVALFEVPLEDVSRFGVADLDGNIVKNFVEKPTQAQAKSNKANAGYYIIEPEALEDLELKKIKVEESLFPKLVKKQELAGYVCKLPYWLDIGTIESYRKANKMMEG